MVQDPLRGNCQVNLCLDKELNGTMKESAKESGKRIPMYFSDALHLQSSDCRLWSSLEAIAAALSPTGSGRLNPRIHASCSHALAYLDVFVTQC